MKVVDSSGWLEYLADSNNADAFAAAIENTDELVVPSISVFEVFKRILQQQGEDAALQAVAIMVQGNVVDLDVSLALSAAKLSHEKKLPMADSIILATARANGAELLTQDNDFEGIDGVQYFKKSV
ncbi:type II toxin-antitoxin system VapC family toxin [Thiothrix subterranea]|uniref:type II toxin-antitoxin system VapC family toxin n=1 Tax=Thiothrix subterranea TaxID=2735563 RepID=UPI00192C0C8B|nr:type II toxin-antitoxin system VapC family toxin [Thiothrix subterranea]QQZ29867.1 type II toxin-antitoxin system VapC family toxin [Thiothrix subterranea]